MIVAKNDSEDIRIEWSTLRTIESMLAIATIDNKEGWIRRLSGLAFEYEGVQMIEDLREYLPIVGLHTIPLDVRQQGQAIKYSVDKDNLHELRWGKKPQ